MLTRRRQKEIAALHRKKGRDRQQAFLIEGLRLVESAVAAQAPLVDIVVAESMQMEARIAALIQSVRIPVYVVPDDRFTTMSDVVTAQGILGIVRHALASPDDLGNPRTVLVLDGVQDPGNVGTLLRTAAWFGVGAILGGPGTADFYNPKVVRATMGGLWDLNLARTDDLDAALTTFQRQGCTCYGADLEGQSAYTWMPDHPSVLVLGSEAHGLSDSVQRRIDDRVRIDPHVPESGVQGVESLNVGVAGGILMYRWCCKS